MTKIVSCGEKRFVYNTRPEVIMNEVQKELYNLLVHGNIEKITEGISTEGSRPNVVVGSDRDRFYIAAATIRLLLETTIKSSYTDIDEPT